MLPASLAADVPVLIATPTSACARAGASFVPSPVIAIRWPSACSRRMRASLSSGVASATKSSTPASAAIAFAVTGLSPVTMTVRIPIRRISPKRAAKPGLTTSLRWMTPSTRAGWSSTRSATTSGVPPAADTPSTSGARVAGTVPRPPSTQSATAVAAPLRSWCPSGRSTPDMRVVALKATQRAPGRFVPSPDDGVPRCARSTIERPSGVSSARLDRSAASASRSGATPSTRRNSTACRLP